MKTILKAMLKRNLITKNQNEYYAQILLAETFNVSDIITELIKDNKDLNQEFALALIKSFNTKVIELVASGNQVNTGLVSISPIIKGSIINKKWNASINRVDANILAGFELNKALINTNIQVLEEQSETLETIDQSVLASESEVTNENNEFINHIILKPKPEPPCGIAFRRWLWNS